MAPDCMSIPLEPSIRTTPVPLGVSVILPFDTETMSSPFTSSDPPSCGVVSSTTFDIAAPDTARPDTIVLLVIFLSPPPDVSTAKNTSSFATVDISDRPPTAIELKFVPSAISRLPAVFVPMVMSSPDTVRSPVTTTSPLNVALPFSAMSISRAVMADEPSVPLIAKFLSAVLTVSSTSVELFAMSSIDVPPSLIVTLPPSASRIISPGASSVTSVVPLDTISRVVVPPSFTVTLAPSASKIISPATSRVKSPDDKSISVPSIVMLSTTTPLFAVTDVAANVPLSVSPVSAA